jgi:hypothetical protein
MRLPLAGDPRVDGHETIELDSTAAICVPDHGRTDIDCKAAERQYGAYIWKRGTVDHGAGLRYIPDPDTRFHGASFDGDGQKRFFRTALGRAAG